MKKILFMSLLAGSLALTACDPAQEKVDNNKVYSSVEDILNGITFTQYSDEACTTPAADGNYIKYVTNPGRQIQIYAYRADGSMNLMASGASGTFSIKPGRGSDPNQSFNIRALNSDGTVTEATTSLTVYVQQELEPEIRLIASDAYGSKVWKWNTNAPDGVVWGNMGYCGGAGADAVANGKWWGVTSEEDFLGQSQHAAEGYVGDEKMDAYFTLGADGTITRCAPDGTVINKGTFNFDTSVANEWKIANLNTTAGTILWPYQINWKDNGFDPYPTTFEVVSLSGSHMTLVYPDGGAFDGLGGWGEATFWQFKAK